jgi:hypothetical protein
VGEGRIESSVEDLTIDRPGRHAMYIVRLDGEVVTVTNTFDSATLYAEGIRGVGRRISITLALPDDLPPALRALERKTVKTQGRLTEVPRSPAWAVAF